jgi:hypothetical protein
MMPQFLTDVLERGALPWNGRLLILLSDPRVHRVRVVDCGEPLAEVDVVPRLRLDPRERDAEGAYGRVRVGVLDRLSFAAASIPDGVEPLIIEGHLPDGCPGVPYRAPIVLYWPTR